MWAIIPEFLTLLLNLLIIKKIKIATRSTHVYRHYPSSHTKKITQTTRVVLILSIIFIVLISPTGVIIILDLINKKDIQSMNMEDIIALLDFLIARKFVLM